MQRDGEDDDMPDPEPKGSQGKESEGKKKGEEAPICLIDSDGE